jgi:hypothetical protein
MLRPPYTVAAVYAPDGMTSPAQVIAANPTNTSGNQISWLGEAIQAAAPQADLAVWTAALEPHLLASGITTPRRVAALLGQAAVEAGRAFTELAEDTCYTHAERLCTVFPSRFPSASVAERYVYDPRKIACRAYAGKNGNGDEASPSYSQVSRELMESRVKSVICGWLACGRFCHSPEGATAWDSYDIGSNRTLP